jgi:hypothetical protein
MKKKQFILTILLISLSVFSTAFAQTAPGGGSEELVFTFKSNNGNNPCGGDAEFKVAFSPMPAADHIPAIKEIWYDDGKTKRQITTIATPVYGELINKTQPYVSYCLDSNVPGYPKNNLDPAIKLTLVFETR